MSYHQMSSLTAEFSECQVHEMRYELFDPEGTRSILVRPASEELPLSVTASADSLRPDDAGSPPVDPRRVECEDP